MLNRLRARGPGFTHALAALVAAILAIGVTVVIDQPSPTPSSPTPHRTITVKLGGAAKLNPSAPAQTVTLDPTAQAVAKTQAATSSSGGGESDLRAEPAPANAPATVQRDGALKPPGQPTPPAQVPLAAVHQAGCSTKLVRNSSARNGRPILLGVLHQTISPDAGWSGVNGVVAWFNNPAAQASSNYVVARTGGQCAYIVPETSKAWAQAGFNSVALSVEVTETGREGSYVVGAGRARVLELMRAWHHRWHLPYRHGAVSGCTVVRSGFVEHRDLGQCGGGHFDDFPPCSASCLDSLIRAAAAGDRSTSPTSSAPRLVVVECKRLEAYRAEVRARRHTTAVERRRARARLALVTRRGYKCGAKGVPARR